MKNEILQYMFFILIKNVKFNETFYWTHKSLQSYSDNIANNIPSTVEETNKVTYILWAIAKLDKSSMQSTVPYSKSLNYNQLIILTIKNLQLIEQESDIENVIKEFLLFLDTVQFTKFEKQRDEIDKTAIYNDLQKIVGFQ